MNITDVIQLLKYYRHDLVNHLQVIQGYHDMGNHTKVTEKLDELMTLLNEERKLMNLNLPDFSLWLLQFHAKFGKNLRMSYHITISSHPSLLLIEKQLIAKCETVSQLVQKMGAETELYELRLALKGSAENFFIEMTIVGDFKNHSQFVTEVSKISELIDERKGKRSLQTIRIDF